METQALDFPKINAVLRVNGTGEVTINGTSHPIQAAGEAAVLREALRLITDTAAQLGRPVKVTTTDPDGQGQIVVSPEGTVSEHVPVKATSRRQKGPVVAPSITSAPEAAPVTVESAPASAAVPIEAVPAPAIVPVPESAAPVRFASAVDRTQEPAAAAASAAPEVATRRSLKDTSFLVSAPVLEPATRGWRGMLTRLGCRMEPSPEELAEREDIRTVSQHWPGPRTVAVVNRKGERTRHPRSSC